MENNDSPYLYEKPIRNRKQSRGTRVAGLTALGLVGAVGLFGGTAIASTIVANNLTADDLTAGNLSTLNGGQILGAASPQEYSAGAQSVSFDSSDLAAQAANQAVITFPVTATEPKPDSIKVQLPDPSSLSFGNTSSATPSAGSYGSSSNSWDASGKASAHQEREDHYGESEDEDHDDDHENFDEDH